MSQRPWNILESSTMGTALPPANGPHAAVARVVTPPDEPAPRTGAKKSFCCCWYWTVTYPRACRQVLAPSTMFVTLVGSRPSTFAAAAVSACASGTDPSADVGTEHVCAAANAAA